MINLYEELGSFRAVADVIGCDHKTVKAHVQRAQTVGRAAPRRSRLADESTETIHAKLEATKGGSRRRC